MKQMKLIRDRYIETIPKHQLLKTTTPEKHEEFLIEKIQEELKELADSDYTDVNGFADVIEVLLSLAKLNNISHTHIEEARVRKEAEKGSFDTGLILMF